MVLPFVFQILQTRFNSFTRDLLANEGRIQAIVGKARDLMESGIDGDGCIATKSQELEMKWDELKEAANARTQVRGIPSTVFNVIFNPLYLKIV